MSGRSRLVRPTSGGVVVRVRLTPKSSRDAVEGLCETAEGPAIKARVRAAPEDGKANEALLRLMAAFLGVPRTKVALAGGATSRLKSVAVLEPAATIAEAIGGLRRT